MNIGLIVRISVMLILITQGAYGNSQEHSVNGVEKITADSVEFKSYWYSGKAEISSFRLEQARYGELHSGYSILVFVTEDFSKEKQVKLDRPEQAGSDKVKILKLNRIKKFDTGIYRYSMMDSVFTPVDIDKYPNTLKISSSSQEWCGNTFNQLNLKDGGYEVESFSYFESEGDNKFDLEKEFLEDELWTRIRIDPSDLPVGEIKIIPGAMVSRLTLRELSVETAEASLTQNPDDPELMNYKLVYPDLGRSMLVTFNKAFPYKIVSWQESYKSGFGENAKELTTKASIQKTIITDYWNKNRPPDRVLREQLGIEN